MMKDLNKIVVVFALCVSVFLCNTLLAGQEVAVIQKSAMAGGVEARNVVNYPERGDAVSPSKEEVAQKIQTLQVPFIANEGQVDENVAFYAKTFGGTVFVTKNGEIVYSLPSGASQESCRDTACRVPAVNLCSDTAPRVHTSPIQYLAYEMYSSKVDVLGMIPEKHESRIMDYVSWFGDCTPYDRSVGLNMTDSTKGRDTACRVPTTAARRDTACRVPARSTGVALKEEFIGAKVSGITGEGESVTKVSYFKGNDPSKWKSNVSTYQLVNLGEIYEGVELKLKAHGNNVEKLLYVKPGASPEQIKIRLSGIQPSEGMGKQPPESPFVKGDATHSTLENADATHSPLEKGARGLSVNEHGELEAETALGMVRFTKPVAYQEIDGKRVEVAVEYRIQERSEKHISHKDTKNTKEGIPVGMDKPCLSMPSAENEALKYENDVTFNFDGFDGFASLNPSYPSENPKSAIQVPKSEYGFTVASYDKTKDLIIDPLLASTFLGGSYVNIGKSIALDTGGNVYVTGMTSSGDFPTTSGAYDTSYNSYDVFVSKLDSVLTSLLASTFLGGSGWDEGSSLTLDSSGNVYVTGDTLSTNFPTTSGAYDTSYNGYNANVFVSKLNGELTSLLASTYLGGNGYSGGRSLTLDNGENVYVTGATSSSDFPTTSGAYDTSYNGGTYDVFVSTLDSGLTSLLASTFLGGSNYGDDRGSSLTLDTSGNVYVTGFTSSSDFPTTAGAYDTSMVGNDAFVSKLDSGLTSLLASTFLGGNSTESGDSLILDISGNVYVTGTTWSTNFPTTSGAYDTSHNGGVVDVFVSKLNSGLTSLLASTFLGGKGEDWGYSLTLNTSGNVYVTGYTESSDFPTTNEAYDNSYNGSDAFVSNLDSELTSLLASTYLGGSGADIGYSLTLNTGENLYVTGKTSSSDFPTTSGAYDTSRNGSNDVFVWKYGAEEAGFAVNTTGDESDANKGDGVCDVDLDEDGEQCTLRAALEEVNLSTDVDTITFDIPTTDYGYSSNTGTVMFTISPKKALPKIKKSLVVDGTSQSNGKIALDGSTAGGKANGLYVSKGDITVKGVSISGFSRNGILNNGEGWVGVENLEITNNERYGILADGNVYINSATQQLTLSSTGTVTVTISGNGDEEDGGGVRSLKKSITAKSVEITDNYGPGIVAKEYIDLKKIKINNNRGPGIQSLNGKITITSATSDYSDGNEINENEGPGIMTGTEMFFQDMGSGKVRNGNKIDIQTHITVINNAGWGIFGRGVIVNRVNGMTSGVSPYTSVISGNGDKGKECYIVDPKGELVKINVYGGGIGSEFNIDATRIEVTDNQGPGIVAKKDIHLATIKSNSNHGPGIQGMDGSIMIIGKDGESDDHEVSGNFGPGIMSGTDDYGYGKNIYVQTYIQVKDNSGWGIVAFHKNRNVVINGIDTGTIGRVSALTSHIIGNGAKKNPCYIVSVSGNLVRLRKYDAGGIMAGAYMSGYLLEVTDNHGDGIHLGKDIYIDTGKVCNNKGEEIVTKGTQTLINVDLCK